MTLNTKTNSQIKLFIQASFDLIKFNSIKKKIIWHARICTPDH